MNPEAVTNPFSPNTLDNNSFSARAVGCCLLPCIYAVHLLATSFAETVLVCLTHIGRALPVHVCDCEWQLLSPAIIRRCSHKKSRKQEPESHGSEYGTSQFPGDSLPVTQLLLVPRNPFFAQRCFAPSLANRLICPRSPRAARSSHSKTHSVRHCPIRTVVCCCDRDGPCTIDVIAHHQRAKLSLTHTDR